MNACGEKEVMVYLYCIYNTHLNLDILYAFIYCIYLMLFVIVNLDNDDDIIIIIIT